MARKDDDPVLTIGEFSRICFVTRKTLRYYDEIGLLRPEHTADNGYRYYTAGQLRTMLLIERLKRYGLSLPEIAVALANPDAGRLAVTLLEKRDRMRSDMAQTQRTLAQLEQDVARLKRREDIMEQNIIIKTATLEPRKLFGIRRTMDIGEFPQRFAELYAAVAARGLHPTGGPEAFYHDEEFDAGHTDIEVAVPVAEDGEGIRVQQGGLHCFATLVGPYLPEAFTAVYAALCQWIEENGYRMAGSPFDRYVRGGDDVAPEDYVTEIYFPIEK